MSFNARSGNRASETPTLACRGFWDTKRGIA